MASMTSLTGGRRGLVRALLALCTLAAVASCGGGGDGGSANPLVPAKLGFTVQPTDVENGSVITPAPRVAVQDAAGTTVTTSDAAVTIALGANPGGAALGGTLTVAATSGVATFPDLTLDQDGTGYTLAASSAGLTGATSAAFDVGSAGPAPSAITVTTSGIAFRSMRNDTQDPAIDTLQVGGTVTWTGLGSGTHHVQSTGAPSFTSQSADAATYGPITFSSTGTYTYQCADHGSGMTGRVEVVP